MILLKLAIKELLSNKKFTFLFILNLSLGLSGFVALDSFKISIQKTLYGQSREILAGDLSVSGRRPLNDSENQILLTNLPPSAERSKLTEVYSMVSFKGNSRLVRLKVIEENYPLYGELILNDGRKINSVSQKNIFSERGVWVQPELLIQLNAQIGDELSIGEAKFKILNSISKDSSGVWSGVSFAPMVYVSSQFFPETNLMKFGATSFHSLLVKIPNSIEVEPLVKNLFSQLTDPAIDVNSHKNASEQVGRLLGYLNDYLGLTSLVALFLCALGASFLYRSYLFKRIRDVAILKSLGLGDLRIQLLYITQIVLLGFLATLPALIFSYLLLPRLGDLTSRMLDVKISVSLQNTSVALAFFSGIFISLLIGYPILRNLKDIKPNILMQDFFNFKFSKNWKNYIWYMPSLLFFWMASVWLSKSFIIGSLFVGTFLLSLILLIFIGLGLLVAIENAPVKGIKLKIIIRNLARQKLATLSCFVAIGLSLLLINFIPQLQAGLQTELQNPDSKKVPSLFIFDIQDEQTDQLKNIVSGHNIPFLQFSPMVRSRLISINDVPFEKSESEDQALTREQERERRFRNRGFNLSFREKLSVSEKIVKGQFYKGIFDPTQNLIPEISVEQRFADRLGLKIDDILKFDIQGLPIEGKITSLRSVKWTSFEPNFFIQFQPGVLEEAPKTWLASLPYLSADKKISLQNEIVSQLTNISIIDVTQLVDRISGMIQQMSLALTFMAYFSILVGFFILFSISSHQALERQREFFLMKILGTSVKSISRIFAAEFLIISALASFLGILGSYLLSYFFAQYFFDNQWAFTLKLPLILFFSVLATTYLITKK